ncbi:MAG: Mu transposase C-terminal domain-containing protein [Chloroflexi bacterium]|nr:Mu transposase C-terminal domain-containing protein [Chloroflexota bacterium]
MKNVRQVTKSVNPKNLAIWTLHTLDETVRKWANEIYHTTIHSALGMSPSEAFQRGLAASGPREHVHITYDDNFYIMTLPSTRRGKAKIQPGRGIQINNIYYWAEIMRRPDIEGISVPVRYDPFDIGRAYVYAENQWHECISTTSRCSEEDRNEKSKRQVRSCARSTRRTVAADESRHYSSANLSQRGRKTKRCWSSRGGMLSESRRLPCGHLHSLQALPTMRLRMISRRPQACPRSSRQRTRLRFPPNRFAYWKTSNGQRREHPPLSRPPSPRL